MLQTRPLEDRRSGNPLNQDSDENVGNDYGDVYDEELYGDIAAYDTEAALENLDLGWDLNSTSVLGQGHYYIFSSRSMTHAT